MKAALVCGEPSGDLLGAGLARALRDASPDIELAGVTGPAMRQAGVRSWLDCSVFSVMGYWEALKSLPALLRARRELLAVMEKERPEVVVGIDAPDLNLGVGARAKGFGLSYVQYVCPSFWIWRPQRARHLARHCDLVLALLPFEQPLCERAGIKAAYVGHRLVDELQTGPECRARARAELGIDQQAKVLALLPGSRRQELEAHQALFAAAARKCADAVAGLEVWSAPLAAGRKAQAEIDGVKQCPSQARTLLQAADAALVKSGTVTLEAALLGCPQTIAYRTGGLSKMIAARRLGDVHGKNYGLPNLIAGERIVPELMQDRATPEALAAELVPLLVDQDNAATAMRQRYADMKGRMVTGADGKAAQAVLEMARA